MDMEECWYMVHGTSRQRRLLFKYPLPIPSHPTSLLISTISNPQNLPTSHSIIPLSRQSRQSFLLLYSASFFSLCNAARKRMRLPSVLSHLNFQSGPPTSQMHDALRIPELQLLIVDSIVQDGIARRGILLPSHRRHLLSLGLSCNMFFQLVLPALWEKAYSITSLIMLFPQDLWESRTVPVQRPPTRGFPEFSMETGSAWPESST
jgi:hypothetical protein